MSPVTIEEASKRLPEIIHGSAAGEEVVVTENDRPVAKLVRLPQEGRKAGSAQYLPHYMAEDFNTTPEGFEEYV